MLERVLTESPSFGRKTKRNNMKMSLISKERERERGGGEEREGGGRERNSDREICACEHKYYDFLFLSLTFIFPLLFPFTRQLLEMTCQVANVLKSQGIKKGDRVVLYLPMIPLAVAIILACARIGAVHRYTYITCTCTLLASGTYPLLIMHAYKLFIILIGWHFRYM